MENVQYNDSRILELIPDGVLTLDRELTIRQCNPAACHLLFPLSGTVFFFSVVREKSTVQITAFVSLSFQF